MKVLSILRVSTEDQSIAGQRAQIEAWAAREGVTVDYREEEGVSGAAPKRPVLDQAVSELLEGDVLVVAALDRLGRSVLRVVRLLDDLNKRGVRVVSLREGLDYGTPWGKMTCVLFAAFAEFERDIGRQRTKSSFEVGPDGKKRAIKSKKPCGAAPAAWPALDLARLKEARAAGWSQEEILAARFLLVSQRGMLRVAGAKLIAKACEGMG